MNFIHVSSILNRNSILKNGLQPSKVKNENHLDVFTEENLCTEDGKALYSWLDVEDNEKFIRDMIFCKVWIHPRNDFYDNIDEEFLDFSKFHLNPIYEHKEMLFDIYSITAEPPHLVNKWRHCQEPDDNHYSTLYHMPEEFAHNDKSLVVFKETQKKFKLIGQALYSYDDKINIKLLKGV